MLMPFSFKMSSGLDPVSPDIVNEEKK